MWSAQDGPPHTIIVESKLIRLDLFFLTEKLLEMCVRMQGNEGTTDVASRILGFFRFLNKTLGLYWTHPILHGSSGRMRERWRWEKVVRVLLVILWRGTYEWDIGAHHSDVPRDLVLGRCFHFYPLFWTFILYPTACWTSPLGYLIGTSNQCHLSF